jgi:ATP-binding cassette subfamily B multidrug efflux pump
MNGHSSNGYSRNSATKPPSGDGRGPMGGHGPMGRGGPMAMMQRGEKPRAFKGTLTKLIRYLGQYRLLIVFIWLLAIASTVAMIFGPKILGNATTTLFNGVVAKIAGTGTVDFTAIGNILLEVLLLYVFSALLSYGQGWIMSNVAMNITYRFRKDIAEKINHMPLRYFDGTSHGEVLSISPTM